MGKTRIDRKYLPVEGDTSILYIKDKEICIARKEGIYYAIDNLCPHAGASLGMGKCAGDWIICPMHDIRFNIKTGKGQTEKFFVRSYPIQEINQEYYLILEGE
ncbi:MAG: Rieske 2Fe-2S domain-containing protein [Chitinophagales bacterium]|nr:Rieske 2Fe-2S domain-containing protein [Chitinophagales bacterium]